MNPTSSSVTPALPVPAASPLKARDDTASDGRFQQVLTREIAQSSQDAAAPPAAGAASSDTATSTNQVASDSEKKTDTDKDDKQKTTTLDGKTEAAPASSATPTAQPVQPDALLALGLPLPAATAPVGGAVATATRPLRATAATTVALADTRSAEKVIAGAAAPVAVTSAASTAPPLPQTATSGKTFAQTQSTAVTTTAPATAQTADLQSQSATPALDALAGQLAAARQIDTPKADDASPAYSALSAAAAMQPAQFDRIAATASPQLAPPLASSAWDQALGDRIVWMVGAAQQSATLTLNPPNLGPLRIELDLSNSQLNASFFAAQPEVRHALEAAMPKLRDMLNDAGLQLGQATVNADLPRHNDPGERQARWQPQSDHASAATGAPLASTMLPLPRSGRGLVDTFA
jgi:flagellar hook-length control protein FliK